MVRVHFFLPYSRPLVCPYHSKDDTLYIIKCQVLWPSRFISLSRKFPVVSNFLIWFLYFSSFKFHYINCWHNTILNIRTFQAACILFLNTKVGLICIWRTLQNIGLCSIIGGRHLKLELDGNISAKSCPWPLTWK